MKTKHFYSTGILILFWYSGTTEGGYSNSDPFSVRFSAALSRYGNFGDVLGVGGASTGSTFSSSINPASPAARNKGKNHFSISPQYTGISFDNGHYLGIKILGGYYQINDRLVLNYGIANAESSSGMLRNGRSFKLEADLYTIGLASSFGGNNICGESSHHIGVNYSRQNTDSNTIIPDPRTSVSDSGNSNSFGLGYLFHTKIGGIRTNSDNQCRSNLALGAAFSAGFGESISSIGKKSKPESYSLRLGAGYRISQGRYLYTDLQYGEYAGRDPTTGINESIDVYRLFSGVQWQIPHEPGNGFRVFLRGGFVVDMQGKKSYTLGLGTVLYNSNSLKIGTDFGYQHNMFPEIASEFGGSDLYNLSVRFTLK